MVLYNKYISVCVCACVCTQDRWPIINFFRIKPTLGEWSAAFRKYRKVGVVLSRFRIGHSYFPTHICRGQASPLVHPPPPSPNSIKWVSLET